MAATARARHSPAVAQERAGAPGLSPPWGPDGRRASPCSGVLGRGAGCCGEAPAERCAGGDGAEAHTGRSAPPRSARLIRESFISWLWPWPHPAASRCAAQVAGAAAPSRCRRLQPQSRPRPAQGHRAGALVRGCGTGRPSAAGAEQGREELGCRVRGGAAGRWGCGGGQTDRRMSLVQCDHTGGAGGSPAPLCTGTCPGAGAGGERGRGAVRGRTCVWDGVVPALGTPGVAMAGAWGQQCPEPPRVPGHAGVLQCVVQRGRGAAAGPWGRSGQDQAAPFVPRRGVRVPGRQRVRAETAAWTWAAAAAATSALCFPPPRATRAAAGRAAVTGG